MAKQFDITMCIGGNNSIVQVAHDVGMKGVVVVRDAEGRYRRDYDATVAEIAERCARDAGLDMLVYDSPDTIHIASTSAERAEVCDCVDVLGEWADGKITALHVNDDDVVIARETYLFATTETLTELVSVINMIPSDGDFCDELRGATEMRLSHEER